MGDDEEHEENQDQEEAEETAEGAEEMTGAAVLAGENSPDSLTMQGPLTEKAADVPGGRPRLHGS